MMPSIRRCCCTRTTRLSSWSWTPHPAPPDERSSSFRSSGGSFTKRWRSRPATTKGPHDPLPQTLLGGYDRNERGIEMKTETKTGRWKYAAIVLIVTLLVGLFWSYVKMGRRAKSIFMEKNTASRAFSTRNFPSGTSITKRNAGSVCGIPVYGCTISEPVDAGRR